MNKILSLRAKEILDSRGNPTVEVKLNGSFNSSVPSGASVGKYEAKELRDKTKRYQGKGVLRAVRNINEIIFPKIRGEVINYRKIDRILIELDGTKDKSKLGVNAILPVSMAVCRAEAEANGLPLWKYIGLHSKGFPRPCFNVINGGAHAKNKLDVQEFMIVPWLSSFPKCLQAGSEIYHALRDMLGKKFGSLPLGDEGGFAPPLKSTSQALDFILKAVKKAGYEKKVKIGLDAAASEFYSKRGYRIEGEFLKRSELLDYYLKLIDEYPLIFLEDPFHQDDWEGFGMMNKKILVIGDDLLATNIERIKTAFEKQACNGLLLKLNQIGTVSEALDAAKLAKSFKWKIMVSHRSGETCDDFIADLAVGISADYIKAGAPAKGERLAKYNRLLEIETFK